MVYLSSVYESAVRGLFIQRIHWLYFHEALSIKLKRERREQKTFTLAQLREQFSFH